MELQKIEVKNHKAEKEAEHLTELFTLPLSESLMYLSFINEKKLFDEFEEWRKKRLFEAVV